MPLSRLFVGALWLAVTVASTAMVWTATSIVAADVTDRPAVVLARQDMASELESGPSGADTTPFSTTPQAVSSTTVPSGSRRPAPAGPKAPVPGGGSLGASICSIRQAI